MSHTIAPDIDAASTTHLQSDSWSNLADDSDLDEQRELIDTAQERCSGSSVQPSSTIIDQRTHSSTLLVLSLVVLALLLAGAVLYEYVGRFNSQHSDVNPAVALPEYRCTPGEFDKGAWIHCSHVDALLQSSPHAGRSAVSMLKHTREMIMRLARLTDERQLPSYVQYLSEQCDKMRDNQRHAAWAYNVSYQLYHPHGCTPYQMSRAEVLDCLQDTRILMVGDSTTQELALDLIAMLENQTTAYVLEPWKVWPCPGKPDNYQIRIISTAAFPSPVLSAYNISIDYLFNGNVDHCNNGGPPEQQLLAAFQDKLDDLSNRYCMPPEAVYEWHRVQYNTYRSSHSDASWLSYAQQWHEAQLALNRSGWHNHCCTEPRRPCDKWSDPNTIPLGQADVRTQPPYDWLLYSGRWSTRDRYEHARVGGAVPVVAASVPLSAARTTEAGQVRNMEGRKWRARRLDRYAATQSRRTTAVGRSDDW